MAKIELLLQAFGAGIHVSALNELLSLPALSRFIANVSFVREQGVEAIATELKRNSSACTFFVGIRNEITSIQAIRRLLELGVKVFAVDTASKSTLFHPKMFLSISDKTAIAVVGSANVTFNGLHNNIEASTVIHLDPADLNDAHFIKTCLESLDELPERFPKHVFRIKAKTDADKLFQQGRLSDEELVIAKASTSVVRKGQRDQLEPIKLPYHRSPKRGKRIRTSRIAATRKPKAAKPGVSPTPVDASLAAEFVLVWESKALTERDLNIPTGATTHATGSMLWKKGATEDIDQRHFFRDEVFPDLTWKRDARLPHYERTEGEFTVVVKRLNYGAYRLKLSHNTSKTSATYKQKNAMTSVSWGPVSKIIGKRDLLGRTMSLYRNGKTPPEFLLEID